jgi:predicted O-methyltransferase YrrM
MPLPIIPRPDVDVQPIHSRNRYLGSDETTILVALIRSVEPRVVIEFGTNIGLTARTLLQRIPSIETYVGIDVPNHYKPTLACQQHEVPRAIGYEAAHDPRFFALECEHGSRQLTALDLEACDAAFIDGDHSFDAVIHDSKLAGVLLRPGGIICWHDYGNPAVDVTLALDHLHEHEGWPIAQVHATWLAIVRLEA